ncbi:MAG: hypothetical protein ACYDCK_10875 [Thermoplasmatota archaeon]
MASKSKSAEESRENDARRLEKLWDVYKAQEREYVAAVDRVASLVRELETRDGELVAARGLAGAKDDEIGALKDERAGLQEQLKEMERLRAELKTLDAWKARVAELEVAYAKEKERLARLFLAYEELEAERDALAKAK